MSSDEDVLFGALQIAEPARRAAYLESACAGDAGRQARLTSLIDGYACADRLFARRPSARPDPEPDLAALRIGRYRPIRPLGEGGVGAVFLAEQVEPVRRTVALKVIKPGMDSREIISRFESERQALALMEHPHIARIFDAGATADGRPYFVMEFIDGRPITRFCDEHGLGLEARLSLFVQVCDAIQHAHQKGVIHRDLKPSNILVTMHDGVPVPKVIDFGIAKAIQGRLGGQTQLTVSEQLVGTPAYMSPEQAEPGAVDIDTRSDIYSLGVLLYEIIAGRTPFDPPPLTAAGLGQIRSTIRETEPPRPSARVRALTADERTVIAGTRGIAPAQLEARLRGDLDWIVMKALEKDRSRRYGTASAFALDLQRYLANAPVMARPPTAAYQLRKFVVRHKIAVAAGSMMGVSLLAGFTFSMVSLVRERAARTRALAAEASERAGRQRAEIAEAAAAKSAREASAAAQAAATGRLTAQELLSFFFSDLAERLDDYGLVPELQAMNERLIAYYQALPESLQTRETRASHAFALAGVDTLGWISQGSRTDRARIEHAIRMFEELEATGALGPFAAVAFAGALGGLAGHHYLYDGRPRDALPLLERAERLLLSAVADGQWGSWAQAALTYIRFARAYSVKVTAGPTDALPLFERALASATEAETGAAVVRRSGLRAARIKADYSDALHAAGRREEARKMAAEARETLRQLIEREPFLTTARFSFAYIASHGASHAFAEWRFDDAAAALREREAELVRLQKLDPENTQFRGTLAITRAGSTPNWFRHDWLAGDFRSARERAEQAVRLLADLSHIPVWRSHLLSARLQWARVCAATGDDDGADRQLAEATLLQQLNGDHNRSGIERIRREVEFERLNWMAVRRSAEESLASSPNDRLAHRDLTRAAFEMEDYATARRALALWDPPKDPELPTADIQRRFDRLGVLLLRIQVLARGGDRELARGELARIWPDVDAVFAAGPNWLFNQVQTARALSLRAEFEPTQAARREWLERAAGLLRPAATAGRLTRYDREVLLTGIEKQLVLGSTPTQ